MQASHAGRAPITSRLGRGDTLVLDGGTGSELQRRGIDVSQGVTEADGGTLGAWSATAMEEAPEVVRTIHEDYLRVGADVVTANSYNTNRGQLALVGAAERMEEFSRVAVELARDARDSFNPEAYVAGSIAPTTRFPRGWDPERVPSAESLRREWGDQIAVLVEAGADLILIESMSAIVQVLPAMDAARSGGLPVFLGVHATREGRMSSGETMSDLVRALRGGEPDAVLLMCSSPTAISATLPELIEAYDGPTGAYANVGYSRAEKPHAWQYHTIDIGDNAPTTYSAYCEEWVRLGAQLVGGCCGTTPEHIAALARRVKPAPAKA